MCPCCQRKQLGGATGSQEVFFWRRERTHARADPVVPGSWLGGVSVRVRRASEERECVMASEYESGWNNDSRVQSKNPPGPALGVARGGLSVVPARDSQGERRAIVSDNEDKKIGETHSSSGGALHRGSTPRLGRCEEGDTEGWKDARVSGRGGESPFETRWEMGRGYGGLGCEACEDGAHVVEAGEMNSIPAGAHKDAEYEPSREPREMRKTSATEGRLRNPPEPRYDGAMYDPRVRNAVHIAPPDVAGVVSVANAGTGERAGEKRGVVGGR